MCGLMNIQRLRPIAIWIVVTLSIRNHYAERRNRVVLLCVADRVHLSQVVHLNHPGVLLSSLESSLEGAHEFECLIPGHITISATSPERLGRRFGMAVREVQKDLQ